MICPQCGAYVEQNLTNCPHCQGPLAPQPISPSNSKNWFKGCSVCGCSCLVVVLIILAILFYAGYQMWKVIEKQLETEPLEFEEVYLDNDAVTRLQDTFESINTAVKNQEKQSFALTLTEAELNYLLQLMLKSNNELNELARFNIDILDDNWLDCHYSYKIGDQKFLNGSFICFVKAEETKAEFLLRSIRFGNFAIQKDEVREINQFFSEKNVNEFLTNLNTADRAQFPFIIESVVVDNQKVLLVFKTKE